MVKSEMEQRAYHGKIDPEDMARSLVVQFNEDETQAQWMRGERKRTIVQIRSQRVDRGDASTAVTLHITPSETGVVVSMAEQSWHGVAADLAKSGLLTLLNPWNIIGEIDDIARNVRRIQLRDEIWNAVEIYCRGVGAGTGVGPQAHQLICGYCGTSNPIGAMNCHACRAPLTQEQPVACPRCGFLNRPEAHNCVNCRSPLWKAKL